MDPKTVIINGIVYEVLASTLATDGETLICVRRPKGSKEYLARRLQDSPLYGGNRGQMLGPSFPRRPSLSPQE